MKTFPSIDNLKNQNNLNNLHAGPESYNKNSGALELKMPIIITSHQFSNSFPRNFLFSNVGILANTWDMVALSGEGSEGAGQVGTSPGNGRGCCIQDRIKISITARISRCFPQKVHISCRDIIHTYIYIICIRI